MILLDFHQLHIVSMTEDHKLKTEKI